MKIAFRACLIALLALLQWASAADAPKPETPSIIETLRAENELLKANLAQVRLELQYQMQVCILPDLIQARWATIQAQQRADKQKEQNAKAPTTPSYSNPTGVK